MDSHSVVGWPHKSALDLHLQFAVSQQELHMPVPHLENATALVTEYAHHQQDNTLTTFGLEPPGPHTLLLKAVLQVHPPPPAS